MSVYGAIMVGMTGLGSAVINGLLSAGGYNASLSVQSAGTQDALVICYLAIELICYAIIAVMLLFLNVEKHVEEDHRIILENQKARVLASGGEWIEPSERLRMEQEAADLAAEEARREELREKCRKKGLNFDEEEARYQAKLEAGKRKGKH